MVHRTILKSFDHRTLRVAKTITPHIRISALISSTLPDLTAMAKQLGADIISPELSWLTHEAVDEMHKAGIQVIPWTANHPDEWDHLIDLGVDAIITDDPASLLSYLKEKSLHT